MKNKFTQNAYGWNDTRGNSFSKKHRSKPSEQRIKELSAIPPDTYATRVIAGINSRCSEGVLYKDSNFDDF